MDPVPAVVSVVLLGLVAALVYYLFYKQGPRTAAGNPVAVRPPAPANITYAPETKSSIKGHQPYDWDLPVEGLFAQPYEPITFRPPNPGGALDNYGVQNYIMWDLSKSGSDCGPDIQNPPFHKTHNLCYYVRSWTDPTEPQV